MSAFDAETAVERTGDGTWSALVGERWSIGDNPNGGYLVAIALRAMRGLGPHPDPLSLTAHFLRPGAPGRPAEVTAQIVREGRTITTVRAQLAQEGTARLELLAAFGDLSAIGSTEAVDGDLADPLPALPAPAECVVRSGTEQGIELPILDRLDIVIHPDQARAGQAGVPEVSGWIRLADGAAPDTAALVLFADAFPPSLFGSLGVVGWVPTIELTVHVRRRPAPGWILGRFTTRDLVDGRMIEDGQLWDETGALVARSRQLGLLLPP